MAKKPKTKRARKKADYKRRKPSISPRAVILIVCEGEKTEPNYFKGLRKRLKLTSVEVEIAPHTGSAPINVVDLAVEKRDDPSSSDYDFIWCVCDVEAPTPHESLDRAYDKARANGLYIVLSNQCFEYWYILHFEKTGGYLSNQEAQRKIKKLLPSYKKNDPNIVDVVFEKSTDAIRYAKQVMKEMKWGNDLRKCNPSTHVYKIVEKLIAISKKKPYRVCK